MLKKEKKKSNLNLISTFSLVFEKTFFRKKVATFGAKNADLIFFLAAFWPFRGTVDSGVGAEMDAPMV